MKDAIKNKVPRTDDEDKKKDESADEPAAAPDAAPDAAPAAAPDAAPAAAPAFMQMKDDTHPILPDPLHNERVNNIPSVAGPEITDQVGESVW